MDLQSNTTFENKWNAMIARKAEEERRQREDRMRVIVTMVNEPEPDDPADLLYVQVRATDRLREMMAVFHSRYPGERSAFCGAPANILPQMGAQLRIGESALFAVTGYWGSDDWRDGVRLDHIRWALDDFIHGLTGYHALVQWAIR